MEMKWVNRYHYKDAENDFQLTKYNNVVPANELPFLQAVVEQLEFFVRHY